MPNRGVALAFNGVPQVGNILRMELSKAFGKHTVGVIDLNYGTGVITLEEEWTPVVMRLYNGSDDSTWYGYVHHNGVSSDNRSGQQEPSVIRYTVMGTSLPLNDEKQRTWKNVTRSGIVRAIAQQYRLRTIIQPTKEVLPFVPQPGDSDWHMLKKLATDEGYRLWVDGSTLLFASPLTLITGVRSMDIRQYRQDGRVGVADSIVKWSAQGGSMVPRPDGTAAQHVATGIDARTKRVLTASNTNTLGGPVGLPTLHSIRTDERLGGLSQVTRAAQTRARNTRGWLTASAIVSGTPSVNPGSVVNIDGAMIPTAQRGLWVVTGVSHRYIASMTPTSGTSGEYLTTLELERDQYYGPTFATSYRKINTRDRVPAIMRNGAFWEAETMEDIRVG